MVDVAVSSLLSGIREAMFIWFTLVAAAVCVPTLLTLPSRNHWARRGVSRYWRSFSRWRRRRIAQRILRRQTIERERTDATRYAEELAVAADRAALTAQRWRAEWVAAQRFKEATWQAYEAADSAARRAALASVFPVPRTAVTEAELASRDRLLRRVAIEALRRGQLSTEQLNDLLLRRRGWELERHPCEYETKLCLVGQTQLLRAYLTASAIERTAWHRAEVAAAARRALGDEAFAASIRARYTAVPPSPGNAGTGTDADATMSIPVSKASLAMRRRSVVGVH